MDLVGLGILIKLVDKFGMKNCVTPREKMSSTHLPVSSCKGNDLLNVLESLYGNLGIHRCPDSIFTVLSIVPLVEDPQVQESSLAHSVV